MRQIDADALKEKVEAIVFGCNLMGDEYQCRLSDTIDYISDVLIEGAPTIGGWIPCSERLPDYREAVLISTIWGVRMAERDAVKEGVTDDFWYLFLDDAIARPMYVYAWMPLPEPYKEETDE